MTPNPTKERQKVEQTTARERALVEAARHVTDCLVEELGNLANENETEDEELAAILGQKYARRIIAYRLRIRQVRAALSQYEEPKA